MSAAPAELLPRVAAAACGAATCCAVLAPALAIREAARRGGLPSTGMDLVLVSAVIGAWHGAITWWRLDRLDGAPAVRRAAWIAALNALAVLALASTLLVLAVLTGFTAVHADLAARGLPAAALWAGVQLVAVGASHLAGRSTSRWVLAGRSATASPSAGSTPELVDAS